MVVHDENLERIGAKRPSRSVDATGIRAKDLSHNESHSRYQALGMFNRRTDLFGLGTLLS